jgi:hypothetical protein
MAVSLALPPEDGDVADLREALEQKRWRRALDAVDQLRHRWTPVALRGALVDPALFLIESLHDQPPDFIAAYRARYDDRAASLLARSPRREFWERYFFCTGMDVAGDRIAAALLDAGRPAAAMDVWTRLYLFYPEPSIPRPLLCARALLAAAAAGDPEMLAGLPGVEGSVVAGQRTADIETLRLRLLAGTTPAPLDRIEAIRWPAELLPFDGAAIVTSAAELPGGLTLVQSTGARRWEVRVQRGDSELRLFAATVPAHAEDAAPSSFRVSFILSRDHLVWIVPPVSAGVVQLDPLRTIWVGRASLAPVLGRWRIAVRDAMQTEQCMTWATLPLEVE